MELNGELKKKSVRLGNLDKGNLIEILLFTIFVIGLAILSFGNYFQFHSASEIFSSVIAFGIFMIAVNTYKISRNDFLLFLGVGYFFVATADLMHTFSYAEMGIFGNASTNMVIQFWIVARIFECFTLAVSCIFISNGFKKFNHFFMITVLFTFLGTCALLIVKFRIFPTCYIEGQGLTKFKVMCEYVISLSFIAIELYLFATRRELDFKLFLWLEAAILLKVITEILCTMYTIPGDTPLLIAHVVKVISVYCIYKGIIETGLQRPYSMLFYRLDKTGTELKTTNSKLREEEEQRKYIEQTLIKNEKCYELIINSSSDAIIVHSDGKLVFANNRAADFFGVNNVADIIGRDIVEFIHPDKLHFAKERVKEILKDEKSDNRFVESKILKSNGTELEIELSSSFVMYQGKPAILSMFRDISSRKQITKLEQDIRENERILDETKKFSRLMVDYFANISHKLKTPLNVILSAIQMLLIPNNTYVKENDKFIKYIKIMRQNCYRLLRLVNNLIDLSKLDSGYIKPVFRNNNIVGVIEDIVMSVSDYINNKGIELVFDTDIEEKNMPFDADKIERIMLNLLSNAIKFTDEGGSIFVNVCDLGDRIRVSIRDTGIGIPADRLDIIFERFGQVDKTLSRNREGSGIGLALVKSFVDIHQGSISVQSKYGEGTEFIMEFPVTYVENIEYEEKTLFQNNVERVNIEFSDIYDK